MNINSILAVTDLVPATDHTVDRAAMLAADHGAALSLMYAAAANSRNASDAVGHLTQLAEHASQRFGIAVRTVVGRSGDTIEQIPEEARHHDLVVIGHRAERSLSAFLYGTRTERIMRLCRCPVLVTKLEAKKSYGRVLVAVDFTATSKALVNLAFGFDPYAEVELFHAISTRDEAKLRSAEASEHVIKAYRHKTRLQAHERMFWLTDSSDARRNRVMSAVGRGDPARQVAVQQEYGGAELIVVGRRLRSAVADFFFGSVARRLLSWSSGDVLVVPHGHRSSIRASAKIGTEGEQGDAEGAFLSNRRRAL
ncbi:universal stress protein UspA [Variovorax sp. WS11]|uniref:universal stress protein n=1 Tax=Variovorax sp. WS11 TaxID=1105204 RepID=UPI000D0D9F90|nr:universal stress protein [Variovorax sp. WS11]NDZ16910.1 universal stress protein [Variovorax sp. WS11]PSL81321.1 universal stress protein UspA [Variovorax sp. WS11]